MSTRAFAVNQMHKVLEIPIPNLGPLLLAPAQFVRGMGAGMSQSKFQHRVAPTEGQIKKWENYL